MPAVGVEWSWPILATLGLDLARLRADGAAHRAAGRDARRQAAQRRRRRAWSSTTPTCSIRDKFSGFDRVEGGDAPQCRPPLSRRRSPTASSLDALFGQSYQHRRQELVSRCSDIADAGQLSGLETDDLGLCRARLARFGRPSRGLRPAAASTRTTSRSSAARSTATTALGAVTASAAYLYLRKIPNIQINSPTRVISGSCVGQRPRELAPVRLALLRHHEQRRWPATASASAFDNSCLTFSVAYSEIAR